MEDNDKKRQYNQSEKMLRCVTSIQLQDHLSRLYDLIGDEQDGIVISLTDLYIYGDELIFEKPQIYGMDLSGTVMNCSVIIRNTEFIGDINFSNATFKAKVKFCNVKFDAVSTFYRTIFEQKVSFEHSFLKYSNFNNTNFGHTTSFNGCTFLRPPKFHEAKLHKDTRFTNNDFKPNTTRLKNRFNREEAEEDYMSYATLRQHMHNSSNTLEEGMFFEYEQRTKRYIYKHDKEYLNYIFSKFYDIVSNYGQSTTLPILWWFACLVCFSIPFLVFQVAKINPSITISWVDEYWLGFWYSAQSIANPLSLFSTDVPFYPKTGWAAFLAHTESIFGVIIVTLWVFALKRRFQKGE